MDATTSSLVVAVVGVLGTLMSGLLTHRSALRSKTVELEHARQEKREERQVLEHREMLEARRVSYAAFNQSLRQFHAALSQHYLDLVAGRGDGETRPEVEEARRALRDVYAEAQMVASDEVLTIGGGVVHLLSGVQSLLDPHLREDDPLEELLAEAKDRLGTGSEGLYEVRQTMRKDLGITELPVERPHGYDTPQGEGS
ncbi:hypothetical protein [Streptomyces sp. NPDC005970]|uniref:hypothetical protein n=1 Tax=Streptomyces sp. NPDC005970 TaxID=3156723 RepID=UPI0033C6D317